MKKTLIIFFGFLAIGILGQEQGEWKRLEQSWQLGYPLKLSPLSSDGVRKHNGIVIHGPFYAARMKVVIRSYRFTRVTWGGECADILQICDGAGKVCYSYTGCGDSPIECTVAGNEIRVRVFSKANLIAETLEKNGVSVDHFEYFVPSDLWVDERFPIGFYWGAATSAFQVEGNCIGTDWWEFADGSPDKCNGDRIGRCTDHYHLYEEDFDIASQLGLTMFRLGIEWARIEPEEGVFDEREIQHYRDVLIALRRRGIEPMVTLHHFAVPVWFVNKGGFEKAENIKYFIAYVERVTSELQDLITYYITINEPSTYILGGWVKGIFPPGKKDPLLAMEVYANCMQAHALSYREIHRCDPVARVSLAKHMRVMDPHPGPTPTADYLNKLLAEHADYFINQSYLDSLLNGNIALEMGGFGNLGVLKFSREIPEFKGSIDYFAVNYYSHDWLYFNLLENPEQMGVCIKYRRDEHEYTVMGERWEYAPHGMYRLMMRLKAFSEQYETKCNKKLEGIIVTENGIGEREHAEGTRQRFIIDHLHYLHQAISEGADVRGYLHWSLIDNFELAEGYWPRFGLVHINYRTLKRTLKKSAYLYQVIIRDNGLTNKVLPYVDK